MALRSSFAVGDPRFVRAAVAGERLRLHTRLVTALDAVRAQESGVVAVARLELDGLRSIAEGFGRTTADRVLGEALRRTRRAIGPGDTVAHLDREELVVLLGRRASEHEARAAVAALLAALAAPVEADGQQLTLVARAGLAVATGADGPDAVLRQAELASSAARALPGAARLAQFDAAMDRRFVRRSRVAHDLALALQRDELTLTFQPVVALEPDAAVAVAVVGFAALARWHHPELGLLEPVDLFGAAESSGLTVPLGRWLLTEACRQLARWHRDGYRELWVVVVVASRELAGGELVADVRDALRRTGAPADRLLLELDETALAGDLAAAAATLTALHADGVRFLVSGSGGASVLALRGFPVDGYRIDRTFTAGIVDSEGDRGIFAGIAQTSAALAPQLLVDGVDDPEQARIAHRLGGTLQQGALFAPPLTAAQAGELLRTGIDADVVASAPIIAPPEPTVSVGEAALALDISASTLRRWADAGTIATVRTAGGHRRISLSALHRLEHDAEQRPPELRTAPLPVGPLAAAARLMDRDHGELARTAGHALYEPLAPGWFAADVAVEHLDRFSHATAAALAAGAGPDALAAGEALLRHAHHGGATLVERHAFADRCGELLVRRLAAQFADRSEQLGARRLFLAMGQAAVSDVPAGV